MATIKYNGMELEEYLSDKPVVFDPAKKMLVWRENSCEPPHEENVLYVNRRYKIVVALLESGGVTMFEYCAEIPEKPAPRIATNRELAKWLAQGKGEWKYEHEPDSKLESNFASINYLYEDSSACNFVSTKTKVRKWSDTEWHKPDVEYMGIADVTTFEDVVKREG